MTTNELIANTLVIPALVEFRKVHPDIQVDLVITDRILDLENGEADLAIRTGQTLAESRTWWRASSADHEMALYCSRDYAARRGVPGVAGELAGPRPDRRDHRDGRDARRHLDDAPLRRQDADHPLQQPLQPGARGEGGPGHRGAALTIGRRPGPRPDRAARTCIDEARASSWIVTRRELKDTPRVRAFIDFMAPYLQQELRKVEERGRRRLADDAATVVPFPTREAG